jgi:hypothetical protein
MSIGSLTSIQQGTLLANEVRAVIAKHLAVDIERVTDERTLKMTSGPPGSTALN